MHLPFGILWYLLSSVLLRLSRFWSQVAKSRYSNLVTYVTCNTQCLPQKAPLSHSVSHKVFLKTLGQTSVALQKYGPKGRTLRDWRGKGGSVGAYTQKDNETKKRGTMSKAGQGGLLFTSLYIIYTMNCAPRLPSMGPWPFHWVFPAPSQLPRSTFQLVTMSSKQSPKVPLALSEFPWLGWIEAIPSESLFRRCAPKRQPSVSTWLLVDEPPLFMGMKPHIPKTNLSFNWLFENLFEPRTCRLIYLAAVYCCYAHFMATAVALWGRCGPRGNGDGKWIAHARNPSPDPKSTIKYHKCDSFSDLKLEIPKYDFHLQITGPSRFPHPSCDLNPWHLWRSLRVQRMTFSNLTASTLELALDFSVALAISVIW